MRNLLALFRIFFPAWRFFDELGAEPRLLCRSQFGINGEKSEWFKALEQPKRGVTSLFLNAEGNLFLAAQSVVERLVDEVSTLREEEADQLHDSATYQIVARLAEEAVKRGAKPATHYQFKITLNEENVAGDSARLDFLTSPVYAL